MSVTVKPFSGDSLLCRHRGIGKLSEFISGIDVGKMYFYGGYTYRLQCIQNGNTGVGVCCRIDHNSVRMVEIGFLDHIYEIAAGLAAYYSSGQDAPKVEIDYTERRNLHKSPGQPKGFVIYHTNYSLVAAPDRSRVTEVENRS